MKKSTDDSTGHSTATVWLTPAECAKRTGLTVKALRVYERYGLLTAKRGQNKWRYYGVSELERLNTVTVLKTLGMTLVQIRDLVRAKEPSLERVLEIQVQAWRTKKADAERGLVLAELALKRVQVHEPLSVDAICNLIRRLELSDHSALLGALILLNEALRPEEYVAAIDFLKRNFDLSRVKDQIQQEAEVFKQLRLQMDSGATPDSAEVQGVLVALNRIALHVGNHERVLKMIEWNPSLGMKFFAIESHTLKKMLSQSDADSDPDVVVTPRVLQFLLEANKHAPWTKPLLRLIADTKALLASNPDPVSAEAKVLVQRYREIYVQHSLGNPDVEAKLVPYWDWEAIQDRWPIWAGENTQAAWFFLSEVVIVSCNKKDMAVPAQQGS